MQVAAQLNGIDLTRQFRNGISEIRSIDEITDVLFTKEAGVRKNRQALACHLDT